MPTCLLCKKDVTSGYVVCGDCAENMKPKTMKPALYGFAAWLGIELTNVDTMHVCSICEARKCGDDSVCGQGIAAWLRKKAEEFLDTGAYTGILGRLKTVCPFPEVFEDVDDADGPGKGTPRRKICHIRADYDDYRWWNTVQDANWDLGSPKIANEIDQTYDELTASDALHDLNALRQFCWCHPEAKVGAGLADEFNFYLEGKTCDFWVRLITRDKDYNMYLHAYAKAEDAQGVD